MSLLLAAAQNADAPVLVAQNVAFGIIAAIMVFGAVRVEGHADDQRVVVVGAEVGERRIQREVVTGLFAVGLVALEVTTG